MAARQTRNVIEFLKIRRGGERFWVRRIGGSRVKCDNETNDPLSPRYGKEFDLPDDEEILDRHRAAPMLYVVR